VERVSKVFPQLQVTLIVLYSGWIPLFMTAVLWLAIGKKGAKYRSDWRR
jgi:hypothetical protein